MANTFIGTIIASVPEFGIALVTSSAGSDTIKTLYIGHLPINDASTGAIPQAYLVDGSVVSCIKDPNHPHTVYIQTPVDYAIGDQHDSLEGRANCLIGDYNEADSDVFVKVLEGLLGSLAGNMKNFSQNVDINALPGDVDITDHNGTAGLHVGRYVAQLKGSPGCFIDVANITNKIRFIAEAIEKHLPLSYECDNWEVSVHDIAVSEAEAFGLADGAPMEVEDDNVQLVDANAIPLYRLQEAEGVAVDGKEELVVAFPTYTDVHYCNTEPPILAKKRTALGGALSEASAAGITSIKSPAIRAIHQVNYNADRAQSEQDDILQPYEYKAQEQEEPEQHSVSDEISDAAINKLLDKLFTGDYLEKLKQKMAEHGLQVSTQNGSLANWISQNGDFVPGATDKQEYGLPSSIELTDPVSGKKTTYYATTSFISQEPDGSILICDGYGSEIRMSRGNIYISPALDLFLRPGRDLSAMAGRHQSYNAQEHTTINSSKSVYIRAIEDLKMVGATGGSGMVSLECAATEEDMLNTGLLIKSLQGATLVGSDLYIGINTGRGLTANVVEEPSKPGTIIIDACSKGSISMRSREQVCDSESICLVASQANAKMGSALLVKSSQIDLFTRRVEAPATFDIVAPKSNNQVVVVRNGESYTISMFFNTTPQLQVESSIVSGGDIIANGSGVFCKGAGAPSIVTNEGIYSVGKADKTFRDPFAPIDINKPEPSTGNGQNVSVAVINQAGYIYQDLYVGMNSFSFPQSFGVPTNLRVPGMRWQSEALEEGKYKTWEEKPVLSVDGQTSSMCYPGQAVWTEAQISKRGYELGSLMDSYIINTL